MHPWCSACPSNDEQRDQRHCGVLMSRLNEDGRWLQSLKKVVKPPPPQCKVERTNGRTDAPRHKSIFNSSGSSCNSHHLLWFLGPLFNLFNWIRRVTTNKQRGRYSRRLLSKSLFLQVFCLLFSFGTRAGKTGPTRYSRAVLSPKK